MEKRRLLDHNGETSTEQAVSSTSTMQSECRYRIDRPMHTDQEFEEKLGIPKDEDKASLVSRVTEKARSKCSCSKDSLLCFISTLFPIVEWLRRYQKKWIPGDLVSGLTVGVVHIPQSLAFSLLAGLAPVFGLYTSFYPVLIYTLMGTSRHISVGTFAVTSLLTRSVVFRHFPPDDTTSVATDNSTLEVIATTMSPNDTGPAYTEIELKRLGVATAVTLLMGIFQFAFGLFRLGFITSYLSEPLIQGFTTGAAFQVVTSQTPMLLGITIRPFAGPLALVFSWIDIFRNLPNVHVATLIISIICIAFLTVGREINIRYKPKLKMPIPTEVILVVVVIIASHFGRFKDRFGVTVIDNVPTGLPPPRLPDFSIMSSLIADGFALAVVGFAISVSLSKMYGIRHGYSIKPNQELLAYGAANIIPSFFSCFPSAAALSRCEIQDNTGGQTQVVGIISVVIVLIVILALGPVFEPLPRSVLACIIVVGLFGIILQLKNLKPLFKTSKLDFIVWMVAFLAVLLLGVDVGLLVGVVFSILTVIARTQIPRFEVLANITDTDIYRAEGKYQSQNDSDGIIIVKMHSSLYYANTDYFRNKLFKAIEFNPGDVIIQRNEARKRILKSKEVAVEGTNCFARKSKSRKSSDEVEMDENVESVEVDVSAIDKEKLSIHSIIVDCASFGFIDFVAGKLLTKICQQMKELNIAFLLTNCNADVQSQLMRSGFMEAAGENGTFITVHDAVLYALYNRKILSSRL